MKIKLYKKIIVNIILILVSLFFIVPIVWMIIVALKPSTAPVIQIKEWFNFSNYSLDNNIKPLLANKQFKPLKWIFNSLFVSTVTTVLILVVGSLAAYGFSTFRFKGKNLMLGLVAAGMMIPKEATIMPLFTIMVKLNLLNTYTALVVPAIAAPMALIILKQFFDSLPTDLYDAAKLDGCGHLRTFFSIALPLSKTSITAVGIFSFITAWNDFLWPFLILSDSNKMTVPIGIMAYNSTAMSDRTIPLTASTLLSLPVIIVFLILQKNIVKGVAMTGIKG